ncbi:MAG TPA: ubiquinol-cytochrome c reductase iron-sulfur subunit [Steroidobacteraceae bacterium]|nr:ubiquinol-cytochrome c reductase iron-sulfur subunit [Steroidobacteraceae bacterium]
MSDHPASAAAEVDQDRRGFLTFATVATGAVGVAFAAVPFIASWSPSERTRAAGAPVEVDLSKLEPGQMVTQVYRKKPIYVVYRTPEMLTHIAGHEGKLKDPQSKDSEQPEYTRTATRAVKDQYLVLDGTCTHLGCLPKARFETAIPELGSDWPGGFQCPCHGSRFDLAGRVFQGSPASTNLRIPEYSFRDEKTLVIGVAPTAKGVA